MKIVKEILFFYKRTKIATKEKTISRDKKKILINIVYTF